MNGIYKKRMLDTPSDIAKNLADKVKNVRKRRKITQEQLAARSNVSYSTLRKFERTGQISLTSFVKLVMELGFASDFDDILSKPLYNSLEEVVNERNQNA